MKKSLSLADRIHKARKEARLSQKDLAAAIHLSDKAISSYEVGRAVPPVQVLKDIGKVTYKPIGYFVEDTDPDDFELQMKLASIERELLQVKQLLQHKLSAKKTK